MSDAKKQREERGLKDWNRKRAILKDQVFIVGTDKVMVEDILQLEPGSWRKDPDVDKIVAAMDNWQYSFPKTPYYTRFMDALIARLIKIGCSGDEHEIKSTLAYGSFEDFLKIFPERMRNRMTSPQGSTSGTYHAYLKKVTGKDDVEHLAHEGFKTGRVDYKLYYGSRDSPGIWTRVIDAGNYHQYLECLDCVRQLTNNELWVQGLRSGALEGAVMLGAGSGDKDLALVQSMVTLTEGSRPLRYTIVDYAFYMLDATCRQVCEFVAQRDLQRNITVKTLLQDFLAFERPDGQELRPSPKKNIAWIIPGGTFGNLVQENRFFDSLATQVISGDLLIIAADTERTGIAKKYSMEQVRRFVEPALRQAWFDLKLEGTLDSFMEKNIRTVAVDGIEAGHSQVPKTLAVEISIELDGKKTVLLTSNRYHPTELTRFVGSKRFEHRATIKSRNNSKFQHFVFTAA